MTTAKNSTGETAAPPIPWTRPQQLLATAYGLWSGTLTVLIGTVLNTPTHLAKTMTRQGYPPELIHTHTTNPTHAAATAGAIGSAVLCFVISYGSYRGRSWAFWTGLAWFGFTGFGGFWVPLRPEAHIGEEGFTLIVHAFVNDLPGLFVAAWMLVGLLRYGRPWAHRSLKKIPS